MRDIETAGDLDLLAELIRRKRLMPSPLVRRFAAPHHEVTLGIGDDHTALVTLSEDAMRALQSRYPDLPAVEATPEAEGAGVERIDDYGGKRHG